MENKISIILDESGKNWDEMKKARPLIHHITNYVAMSEQAHTTLAIGASPVMALSADESGEMSSNANALLINIGTPSRKQLEAMKNAQNAANIKGIPILLDPVGYGATEFRNYVVDDILKNGPVSVIKGNYGEILALSGRKGAIKGVDSLSDYDFDFPEIIKELSKRHNALIIATGKEDLLTDGKRTVSISGGNYLLTYITGSGCLLGSIITSVLAVSLDLFSASISGLVALKIVSEKVKNKSIGTFRMKLFDEMFVLEGKEIASRKDMLKWI